MKFQGNNFYPELASIEKCTSCFACVGKCNTGALTIYMHEDGHRYVKIDYDKCIGCKSCESVCKQCQSNYGENTLEKSSVYAAWSKNEVLRKNGTSGGVFAACAEYILSQKGVIIGASLKGNVCKHILISNINQLYKLQGSKYMESSMEDVYRDIEIYLEKGPVLFSGVGCQCAGVLAYFAKNKNIENLYTMDLVCGGAPSKILVDKFMAHYPEISEITSFRSKDKYKLKVLKNNREVEIEEKNLPLHGFNCEMTNRYNCYNCQYAKAHRKTDITIGDLWNYEYMKNEHANGISTVIIHSERGEELIKKANLSIFEIKWSECINFCKRIVWGKSPIFSPRRKLIENSKRMNYEMFSKLYCIAMRPSDVGFELFRVYRYLVKRIYDIKAKIYINRLISSYDKKENNTY